MDHGNAGLTKLLVLLKSLLFADLETFGLAGGQVVLVVVDHC